MANDINVSIMSGRLTADPSVKTVGGYTKAEFRIVSNEKYKDKETPVFIDVEIWGQGAEFASANMKKGSYVCVNGKIAMSSWEDKETKKTRNKLFFKAEKVSFMPNNTPKDTDAPAPAPVAAAGKRKKPAAADDEYNLPDYDDHPF